MPSNSNRLTVFEHQRVTIGDIIDGFVFDETILTAMQEFYGRQGVPYFSLRHKGVQFSEYVGVIQIGKVIIEVLPKADRTAPSAMMWRDLLIDMIRTVGIFELSAPSSSLLKIKPNSILDIYLSFFVNELETLLHQGLVKRYRKTDHQSKALKGNLLFAQQIQKNLVHQELFFVRNTVYDVQHVLHAILYKALGVVGRINSNVALSSRIGVLCLGFPPQDDLKISAALFEKITLDRKTAGYRNAFEIARLILLNYHPDVRRGHNNVLALMFDMNILWERFVFVCLKTALRDRAPDWHVTTQTSMRFWRPVNGYTSSIRADIRIANGSTCMVLDTKWKNLYGYNPSPDDLRQLYVYHEYYDAQKVALVYPGEFSVRKGFYHHRDGTVGNKECSVFSIPVHDSVKRWREEIAMRVLEWMEHEKFTSSL